MTVLWRLLVTKRGRGETELELYYHTGRRQDGEYTIELAKHAARCYVESIKTCIAQVIAVEEIQHFARSC